MMNVLDSPLDALVFDYVSFGIFTIVNNLWTWVAVITAAVSFWRIRAAGAGVPVKSEPPTSASIDCDTNGLSQPVAETSLPESTTETPAPSPASSAPSVFEDDGVTKGKFVVYYEDKKESDGEVGGEWTVFGDGRGGGGDGGGEWWGRWERVLMVRMGNIGWYSHQDLTTINGNVVRLWDGVRKEKYSSDCSVW